MTDGHLLLGEAMPDVDRLLLGEAAPDTSRLMLGETLSDTDCRCHLTSAWGPCLRRRPMTDSLPLVLQWLSTATRGGKPRL
jgi:hypothetical protein